MCYLCFSLSISHEYTMKLSSDYNILTDWMWKQTGESNCFSLNQTVNTFAEISVSSFSLTSFCLGKTELIPPKYIVWICNYLLFLLTYWATRELPLLTTFEWGWKVLYRLPISLLQIYWSKEVIRRWESKVFFKHMLDVLSKKSYFSDGNKPSTLYLRSCQGKILLIYAVFLLFIGWRFCWRRWTFPLEKSKNKHLTTSFFWESNFLVYSYLKFWK